MRDSSSHWSFGNHIVFRQIWRGRVWAAIPATIIDDRSEMISVYVAPRTVFAGPACKRQEYLRVVASGEWNLTYYEWAAQHHVWASVPGEACSIWTMWTDPDWMHLGWKVNPETPIKRTPLGFDTTDHVLDVVIDANFDSWAWKDEAEFAEAIDLGLFTTNDSEQIRKEAIHAVKQAFTDRREQLIKWSEWRPLAGWELPILTGQWTVV